MSKSHYQAGVFTSFRNTLSGGVKWENKTEDYRKYSKKNAFEQAMSSAHAQTNEEVSKTASFIAVCGEFDIKPTSRQASKFRHKRGSVYRLKYSKKDLSDRWDK